LDNRGLARLKIGLLEEGRADIEASLAIDDKQPETYRDLGIYFLLKKEWNEALALFEKAKEMDCDTDGIDQYLSYAKNKEARVDL
jgi:lipoprotein NlpI